jgi:hypothetical protein
MLQVWKDQRLVQMISTIHESTIINTRQKDGKTNMEIKKHYVVFQYDKFMKGIDRADQYLNFYSVLRNTVKWSIKVVMYLLNRVLFNAYFVQDTKYKQKSKVQELHARGRKVLDIRSPELK